MKNFLNINRDFIVRLKQAEAQGVSSTRFNNSPLFWQSAKGCEVKDYYGKSYLDCTSSYGVMGVGYAHPHVMQEVHNQMKFINHTMCEIYPHEAYLCAIENIKAALNRNDDQVIMTVTGSDAIDVALKLCFRYTNKRGVIAFCGAFHGQTLSTLAVTGHDDLCEPFAQIIRSNTKFVPYPNLYRNEHGCEEELLENCISQIRNILSANQPDDIPIGAILVEPMQNTSGYIIPPKGFLQAIRNLCNEYKILMVVDEIFTGFGRCGKWMMSDYESVNADIICVGKVMTSGFPAAACLASQSIMASLDYTGLIPLHGSTFTGNAIACAAINSTIHVLQEEQLIEKSYDNGEYFRSQLRNIFKENPFVGDIRGYGSATMIEFVSDKFTKRRDAQKAAEFSEYLMKNSIISLVSGLPYANCVAICPPFIMERNQIDFVLEICSKYKV